MNLIPDLYEEGATYLGTKIAEEAIVDWTELALIAVQENEMNDNDMQ